MRQKLAAIEDFLVRYRYRYTIGIAFLVAVDALQLLVPRLLGNMTDEFRQGDLSVPGLARYVGLIIGIACLVAVGRYFWRTYIFGTARLLDYHLRDKFFAHLVTLSADFFNENKTGDLMAHATNDISAVRQALAQGVMLLVDAAFLGISTIVVMLTTVDLRLAVLALIPLPFVGLMVTRFSGLMHSRFVKVQEAFAALTDRVQENLGGIRVVKAFVQEEAEMGKFGKANQEVLDANMNLARVWGIFWPLVQYIAGLSFVIVLGYGGRLAILGDVSLGDFVAFSGYLGMATWPMMAIGWVVNTLQRGMASLDRLNIIFQARPEITDAPDSVEIDSLNGEIEFSNLTFAYSGKREPTLRSVDLKIPAGKTVGVLGRTGSGKSTLVDLLLRVHNTSPGELLIDGIDISKIPLRVLRRDIGYVPQDNFLFSASIRENMGFAGDSFSDDEIEEAAELACIADDVREFPEGFDTRVGERGVTLSGGQKQRISIARALIKDPKILILDDCFSAVDTRTEEKILSQLREVRQGCTTILISHRISTLKEAEEIIVLDEGRIIERGDHEALVAAGGLYSEIYERQLLEAELSSNEDSNEETQR